MTVTAKGALPKPRSAISGKVIGWKARWTSKDRVTATAATVLASAAWVARSVQVPTASRVTLTEVRASPSTREDVAPDTVHTLVVVLDTTTGAVERPPVTVTGNGASPYLLDSISGKDTACAASSTAKDRLTGSAARWPASPA